MMDLQRLTIGQMAQLNHVSEQTLRLYDKEGILKAQEVDPETGYRYYHILQSARIDLIQNMKMYGLTLKQIRNLLDCEETDTVQVKLEAQYGDICCRLQELEQIKGTLKRVLENYKKYEVLPKNGEIFLEYQPERTIYSCYCPQDFFEEDESGYEYMLRQMKKQLISHDIPLSLFCNIGTLIRKDCIEQGKLSSHEVFLFADERMPKEQCEILPQGMYVCMCEDDFTKEAEGAKKLLKYIREHKYCICGDYICEVVIDFPVMEAQKRQTFSKIQIPVKLA